MVLNRGPKGERQGKGGTVGGGVGAVTSARPLVVVRVINQIRTVRCSRCFVLCYLCFSVELFTTLSLRLASRHQIENRAATHYGQWSDTHTLELRNTLHESTVGRRLRRHVRVDVLLVHIVLSHRLPSSSYPCSPPPVVPSSTPFQPLPSLSPLFSRPDPLSTAFWPAPPLPSRHLASSLPFTPAALSAGIS